MNKIARKLVLSALAVILTVVALGTTTFAWFTLTNTAVVQSFEAQIVADTGIEVALGAAPEGDLTQLNWVTNLTTAEIGAYITAEYGAFRFNHVTSTDGVDFFTLGVGELTGTLTGYLELPLHFRSNSAVAINWTSVTLTSTPSSWTSDVAFTAANGTLYPSGSSILIDASDSMRISVEQVVGINAHTVVYEKPEVLSNLALGAGGDFRGAETFLGSGIYVGEPGSYNYYYAKTGSLPFGSGAVVTASTITALSATRVLDLEDGVTNFPANATYYGQVVIRVWLEGYDQNAYNSILARYIQAGFTFVGATSI